MRGMTTNDALFSPTPMPDAPIGTARAEQLMALSGLEIIGAIMLGKLPIPPMARTLLQKGSWNFVGILPRPISIRWV